jgi:hypothetical protein
MCFIPRISHGHGLTAAFRGIWLHAREAGSGVSERTEQEFWLVAGVGFEPT